MVIRKQYPFKIFSFICLLILVSYCNISLAQSDSLSASNTTYHTKEIEKDTTSKQHEKSYFETSFSFLSNSVYNGRHDSLPTAYYTPMIGYYNKSGFYITGSLSYMHSIEESRIDLFGLTTGYDFTIIKDKLTGGIYAAKSYYNKGSTSIKSDEKGSIGANLSSDFDIITLSIGTDVIFGSKTDIRSILSLSHEFNIEGENTSSWSLTPTASVVMSTLNSYEGYTNRRIGKNGLKRNPNLKSETSVTTINNHNGFTLMDYEMMLPIAYEARTWCISFTPQLSIPQNPIFTNTTTTYTYMKNRVPLVQTVNSTPESENTLKPEFFVELAVHWKLFGGQLKDK